MAVITGTSYQMFAIQVRGSVVESNMQTKNVTNTHYYYCSSVIPGFAGNSAANKALLVAQFHSTCWNSVLQSALNSRYVVGATQCRAIDVISDPFSGSVTPTAVNGPSSDSLPLHDCVVFEKATMLRGRSFTSGKWRYGPASEGDTTKDELASTGLSNWQACKAPFAAALSVTISSVAYQFVPVHISAIGSNMISSPTTFTYAPITSVSVLKRLGSNRRRNQKSLASEPALG